MRPTCKKTKLTKPNVTAPLDRSYRVANIVWCVCVYKYGARRAETKKVQTVQLKNKTVVTSVVNCQHSPSHNCHTHTQTNWSNNTVVVNTALCYTDVSTEVRPGRSSARCRRLCAVRYPPSKPSRLLLRNRTRRVSRCAYVERWHCDAERDSCVRSAGRRPVLGGKPLQLLGQLDTGGE